MLTWGTPRAPYLLVAATCYVVGSFGVTAAFNVPRNERLARLQSSSPEALAYWPTYLREWLFWNHVRTAASVASAVAATLALVA